MVDFYAFHVGKYTVRPIFTPEAELSDLETRYPRLRGTRWFAEAGRDFSWHEMIYDI